MMSLLNIAQISDLHVAREGTDFRAVDTRGTLLRVLKDVADCAPEYLVLSGDLCADEGDKATYRWVKEKVDALGIPYFVMAGNHDDSRVLADTFGVASLLHDGELYYREELGGEPVIFADTARAEMSDAQFEWFAGQIRDGVRLVFIHHPPIAAGVRYMDANYPFRQTDQMRDLFDHVEHPTTVFCGHYHADQIVQRGNVSVFVTPSLAYQIDPDADDLVVDHRIPAWRKITVDGVRIVTSVRYLFPRG
jgi:3',5'-cyclic-AMP phosphodiesterase